jgi:CIC family chloride channel protein
MSFNILVFRSQDLFARLNGGNLRKILLIGGILGGGCGILALVQQAAIGGGFALIPIVATGNYTLGMLVLIFIVRMATTLLCFGSGAPGGIFAPMLALGTVLGTAFGMASSHWFPDYGLQAGTFAIAGARRLPG